MTHNWIWMVSIVTLALTITSASSMVLYKDRYDDDAKMHNDQAADDDTKSVLIHNLLLKMLSEEQEQGGASSYVDSLRDPDVKKAHLTKKINNMCHFKLCNLGRR